MMSSRLVLRTRLCDLLGILAPEAELAGGAHGSERRKAPKMLVPAVRHPVLGV
jgi:hypothetical protein